MPAMLTTMLERMQRIAGDRIHFMDPGPGPAPDTIRNEPAARMYLKEYLFQPLRYLFNGLIRSAHDQVAPEDPSDTSFFQALRRADRTTITVEDRRFMIQTPYYDDPDISGGRLDLSALNREIPINYDAHDLIRSVLQNSPPAPPSLAADSGLFSISSHSINASVSTASGNNVEDGDSDEEAPDFPYCRRIPDLCLCWVGRHEEEATLANGGIPMTSMEVKDPNRITYDEAKEYICDFSSFLDSTASYEIDLFETQKIMSIRSVLNLEHAKLYAKPKRFFSNLCRHYEYLFFNRMTYGHFCSGGFAVAIRLHWEHAKEPGQHLHLTIFDCATNQMEPKWEYEMDVPRTLTALVAAYSGLQLEKGLIPMPRFLEALRILQDGHDLYDDTAEANGNDVEEGSSVPRVPNLRKRKASELDGRDTSEQGQDDGTPALEESSLEGIDDLNRKFLNCIKTPRARQEIIRFLSLDECKFSTRFPKADLPFMLCARFPFRSDLVEREDSLRHLRNRDLCFPEIEKVAGISDFDSDFKLFHWFSLVQGCVPIGLNEAIARRDLAEKEQAQRQPAHDASSSKNTHGDCPSGNGLDSSTSSDINGWSRDRYTCSVK